MTDGELIELFWAGEERALAELAGRYGPWCRAIAGRILADERDVEECVSDCWLAVWRAIPPARPEHFKGWLGAGRLSPPLLVRRFAGGGVRPAELAVLQDQEHPAADEDETEDLFREGGIAVNRQKQMMDAMGFVDHDLVEEAARTDRPRRRLSRGLLAAACAAVMLAGTAFAVETFTNIRLLNFFRGEPVGQASTPFSGYELEWEQVTRFPEDSFTREAWALGAEAAAADPETGLRRSFADWAELEEFLGLHFGENQVLRAAERRYPYGEARTYVRGGSDETVEITDAVHCIARFAGDVAGLTGVDVQAAYLLDGVEITVSAEVFTQHGQLPDGETAYYYRGDQGLRPERYVTGGLEAVLIQGPDRFGDKLWLAHLVVDGVPFTVEAEHADGAAARGALERVLDGFEA